MNEIITPPTVITITLAIMQALKYADPNNVFKRFYPILSILLGLGVGYFFHLSGILLLTTSLAIAGTYDGMKFSIMGK